MPTASRILLAGLLLLGTFVVTSPAAEPTDADIARNMGPPFYSRAILPTPREAEYGPGNTVLIDGPARIDHCELSFPQDAAIRELLERLCRQRLDRYREQFEGNGWTTARRMNPVEFRLASEGTGDLTALDEKLAERIPELPSQGYVLQIDEGRVIGIGKDRAGVVNALASFLQLVHVDGGRLVVPQARIVDWPTFTIRYTSEYRLLGPDYFDWMMLYKINGFAASYRVFDWRGPTNEQREQLETIGEYIERYGTMHFLAQLHLSGRAQGETVMDSRNPEHRDQLFQTIRTLLEVGKARHLWICYDDTRPELQPMEIEAGFESPAQAHAALLEDIHAFATGAGGAIPNTGITTSPIWRTSANGPSQRYRSYGRDPSPRAAPSPSRTSRTTTAASDPKNAFPIGITPGTTINPCVISTRSTWTDSSSTVPRQQATLTSTARRP